MSGYILLNIGYFRNRLNTDIIGKSHIIYYSEVTSTNDAAVKQGKVGEVIEGTLYLAEHQTAGRGRYGRVWEAPRGKCILASVVFRQRLKPDQVHLPNLIGALSIAQGIKDCTGLEALIKHPNDVRIEGKKVAGVLTEIHYDVNGRPFFVLGFGVNVNMTQSEFPEKLRENATSVLLAASESENKEVCRETLLQLMLNRLEANYLLLKSDEIDLISDKIKLWEEKE